MSATTTMAEDLELDQTKSQDAELDENPPSEMPEAAWRREIFRRQRRQASLRRSSHSAPFGACQSKSHSILPLRAAAMLSLFCTTAAVRRDRSAAQSLRHIIIVPASLFRKRAHHAHATIGRGELRRKARSAGRAG